MPTLTVPPEFPLGLTRGAQNGQAAAAEVLERIERAIGHLCGHRRHDIPLWCLPRAVTSPYTWRMRVTRQPWTGNAVLYLTYGTYTPYDRWKLLLTGPFGSQSVPLAPTSSSVSGALEAAIPFRLGSVAQGERADSVDLVATLTFTWRDSALAAAPQAIALLSAQISIDPVAQITGS